MVHTKIKSIVDHELSGTLTKVTGEIVTVESMVFDGPSEQKLLKILAEKNLSELQLLFLPSLIIKAEDVEEFRKDQTAFIKEGNKYSYTGCVKKPRYKMGFKAINKISGDILRLVEGILGSVEFDITDKPYDIVDDIVIYNNVPIVFYPGKYDAWIVED